MPYFPSADRSITRQPLREGVYYANIAVIGW
jgi:hypothetical protein